MFHRTVARLAAIFIVLTGSAQAGLIWGLKSAASSVPSQPPTHLFNFPDTGVGPLVDVGAVTLGGADIDADALAYSPDLGLLAYQLTDSGSQLISIDSVTAAATAIGSLQPARQMRGAAFDGSGTMWVLDAGGTGLLLMTVNPGNGNLGPAVPLTFPVGSDPYTDVVDLAFQPGVGVAYLTAGLLNGSSGIFAMNLSTGALTLLYADNANAADGYPPMLVGAAFSYSSETLFGYDVNYWEDILAYNPAGFARTQPYANILAQFNAGRGDLASGTPEPGTLVLALGGLALAIVVKRKRHIR